MGKAVAAAIPAALCVGALNSVAMLLSSTCLYCRVATWLSYSVWLISLFPVVFLTVQTLIDFSVGCLNRRRCLLPFPCTLWLGFRLSAVRPDAFADHLRTSECGATALDDSLAALVANMGMPVGVAFVIATAFANIAASMNAVVATVVTKAWLGFHNGRRE